jgi:hypothetical protein
MFLYLKSDILDIKDVNGKCYVNVNAKTFLFSQFFIHKNEERNKEIRFCLLTNVLNPYVSKIYLINERQYSFEEMGITRDFDKIVQIITGRRLCYSDVIRQVELLGIVGYVVLHNIDIFFDETLNLLGTTEMDKKKIVMAQLRWEYEGSPSKIKIFGGLIVIDVNLILATSS